MLEPEAWAGGRDVIRVGMIAGAIGLVAWLIGLSMNAREALFSLLIAFAWISSLFTGALILLMSIHAARSKWPIVLRRLLEAVTAGLPLLIVLFLPLAILARRLYVWAGAAPMDATVEEAVRHKGAWFSVPFFLVRSFGYLAVWTFLGERLREWSLKQDVDGDPLWARKSWGLSGIGLVIMSLTLTFAAFDWFMSLTPAWKSSVYGVYFFAGGFVSTFALMVVLMWAALRAGLLRATLNPNHFLSTGKYLFAFTIFWAYVAYGQFFIIWIADIPAEATWWLPRMNGWGRVSVALIFAQFVVPFFVLLSHDFKKQVLPLTALSLWVLAAHYLDMVWLIAPALSPDRPRIAWTDAAALLLVAGSSAAFCVWRAQGHALVPRRDARLSASLAYEGS